jgi:enoyl-[acyl-carrier protein] reductase I
MAMSFLHLEDKTIAVIGLANRKSVAHAVSRVLLENGARVLHIVRDETIRDAARCLTGDAPVLTCDVESDAAIVRLHDELSARGVALDGLVHSIAYANYSAGFCPFHETRRPDFLQAVSVSCYSLIGLVRELKPLFRPAASVVTISISTTRMAAENYGYMGPVKAALDSTVVFLAKSLSADTQIRVNAVGAGLLKTSASAGIPGYVDSYLFAEQVIPRKRALATDEVGNVVAFLLSARSSGINAQTVIVDAGMGINYFDRDIVRRVVTGSPRS